MAETLLIPEQATKEEIYRSLLPQIRALIADETHTVANLANVSAVLHEAFRFFWVGFYTVEDQELVLGPFQGPIACTRIAHGQGVCGKAWAEARTIVVPDVSQFPGHIACSSASQSEIVVPIIKHGKVIAVLDVDSDRRNAFDETDRRYLEELATLVGQTIR